MSLVAAETEAAAADLWRVVVEKGVVQPKVIPQHIGTLRGAAGYLWMTQGAPAVKGQHDQAAAQQELLNGIRELVSCLSRQAPQQCAQAAAVPRKKPLPPADSVPVRPLDERFLQRHTANEWVAHFSSMLSEYDAMENEAKLVLLRKVQLPAAMELKELVLQLDLKGLCGELKQLTQRRADCAWRQFWKLPEQTFALFLAFIREEAKRAGITLGNEFLARQIMAQIRSRQERTMLLDHVGDPDKLAEEADKLLQSAFEYGPLQDDTAMVDCVSDDSESEDERVCAVVRGAPQTRQGGGEALLRVWQGGPHRA